MLLENLELTLVQEWTTGTVGKKKTAKPIVHRDEVGSVKLNICLRTEALEKLVDVIQEEVFEQDQVKIEISATSVNW
jgi:hypothetical protein|tara:strand:+ start:257 stop:487 length:231 start_codon:yes stop_codon:yes gene_type:complete